jgi:hypothetical protein
VHDGEFVVCLPIEVSPRVIDLIDSPLRSIDGGNVPLLFDCNGRVMVVVLARTTVSCLTGRVKPIPGIYLHRRLVGCNINSDARVGAPEGCDSRLALCVDPFVVVTIVIWRRTPDGFIPPPSDLLRGTEIVWGSSDTIQWPSRDLRGVNGDGPIGTNLQGMVEDILPRWPLEGI